MNALDESVPPKDKRVTLKINREVWDKIAELIKKHPEWGIMSVNEFVRRAIDTDLRSRLDMESSRVINLSFAPEIEDKHRKDP